MLISCRRGKRFSDKQLVEKRGSFAWTLCAGSYGMGPDPKQLPNSREARQIWTSAQACVLAQNVQCKIDSQLKGQGHKEWNSNPTTHRQIFRIRLGGEDRQEKEEAM